MLSHHYKVYRDWKDDIYEKRNAGVEMEEIAAQLQVLSVYYGND
jgi:hypothetical protein